MREFTKFNTVFDTTGPVRTWDRVVAHINSPEHVAKVVAVEDVAHDKDARTVAKQALPCLMPAGVFAQAKDKEALRWSGLTFHDVDNVAEGYWETLELFENVFCDYPALFAGCVSASGTGLSLFVAHNGIVDSETYASAWRAGQAGLTAHAAGNGYDLAETDDESVKNPNRKWFISGYCWQPPTTVPLRDNSAVAKYKASFAAKPPRPARPKLSNKRREVSADRCADIMNNWAADKMLERCVPGNRNNAAHSIAYGLGAWCTKQNWTRQDADLALNTVLTMAHNAGLSEKEWSAAHNDRSYNEGAKA